MTAEGGDPNFCAMENITAPLTTGAPPSGVTIGRDRLGATLLLGVGGLLAVLSVYLYRAPTVQPATAPATAFSAERAFHHVEAIAQRPHPNRSSEIAAVRDYLLGELQKLGLKPLVQRATVKRGGNRPDTAVENILVRKSGTMSSRAVMLVAHYDTVSRSPGAADDGAAVAALLETLRALNAGPPLRNDLIVLITDGEEPGMLGARAFVAEHPWLRDVGVVCNFEARGTRGPSIMFETSSDNGRLIREFARAAPYIIANSLSEFIYRRMPNNGDFTIFRRAGVAGLNFAFIDGVEHYHRASDTPANLDQRSLQHHGELALRLARHFGDLTLPLPLAGDAVYFNVLGGWFVYYSKALVLPAALLLAGFGGVILGMGHRRGLLRIRRVAGGLLVLLAGLVAGGLWAWLAYVLRDWLIRLGGGTAAPFIVTSVLSVLTMVVLHAMLRWRLRRLETLLAALTGWTLLALGAGVVLPEASYLFFWPAVPGWLALALWLRRYPPRSDAQVSAAAFPRMLCLSASLGVVLVSPLVYLGWIALPSAYPVLVLLCVLVLALALPCVEALVPVFGRRV